VNLIYEYRVTNFGANTKWLKNEDSETVLTIFFTLEVFSIMIIIFSVLNAKKMKNTIEKRRVTPSNYEKAAVILLKSYV
jgi:hypothetical protein